jgi:hypothetical protein
MATNYNYNQSDFLNATIVNQSELFARINKSPLADNNILSSVVVTPGILAGEFDVEITFAAALSVGDQSTLDIVVANYQYHPFYDTIVTMSEIYSIGTNAGAFVADTWTTRGLNYIYGYMDFCSLSANQFTLAPGSYTITTKAIAYNVQNHQIRLQNITNTSTPLVGTVAYASNNTSVSEIYNQIFTIYVSSVFEIQHICTRTDLNGLGRAGGFGNEVYVWVTITQNPELLY